MIDRSQIQYASFDVIARAKRTWIRSLPGDKFRVRPKIHGKVPRLVVFLPGNKVLCVNQYTGEPCEANEYKNVCYHCFKANEHREWLKKKRRKAA